MPLPLFLSPWDIGAARQILHSPSLSHVLTPEVLSSRHVKTLIPSVCHLRRECYLTDLQTPA